MNNSAAKLLSEIERFLARHGMSATTFGIIASNDGHLVRDMRAGRQLTLARADRVRAFMASYRRPPSGPRRRSKSHQVAA